MLPELRDNLRRLQTLLERLRARGIGAVGAWTRVLPAAVLQRLYAKAAYAANRRLLEGTNRRRFRAFVDAELERSAGRYFVIVMPRTLHYLLPCLQLLPRELPVALIANGAQPWELAILESRCPDRPLVRLAMLPGSSVAHGDMIDMMLDGVDEPFGILDHDLYVFDSSIFARLRPRERECMVGAMGDVSRRTGLAYPLTHLLVFNTPVVRDLMRRYGVSASMYRTLPARAKPKLSGLGLRDGAPLKDHHRFFDTLHVLLGLAYAEGLAPRIETVADPRDVIHIGGTSIGTHHTKDLSALYMHARFMEFCGDPEIQRGYAHLIAPFTASGEIRERLPATAAVASMLDTADELLNGLGRARQAMGSGS